ncbi:MGMT family protein [Gilvimarinus polysaccharolyticus]|uniref:MGMT family protein n=1 Tax=Gilvimarinus polysaccharolyticus TaxID=863921 RepID=UPI0006738BBD|nr:MGMT family protein [Gilvimarinus polysaccharolyticus]
MHPSQPSGLADTPPNPLYTVLAQIPVGRVITYGQLATLAGRPGAARWVGSQLRALPNDTQLPWHRVVAASGKISLPAGSDAAGKQRTRLEAEGIAFRNERIALAQYRWPRE